VSHRVRKKVSGPLHKETTYGDTGEDVRTKNGNFRQFVTRKRVEELSKSAIEEIRDLRVRKIIKQHVASNGGEPKKAFSFYPKLSDSGPEIRKVRLTTKQQLHLMAEVGSGYADLGSNHHIAIYRGADGKSSFEVVSLLEAARRVSSCQPVIRRNPGSGLTFVMSLSLGEAIEFPAGEEKGIWIVKGIEADGRAALARHNDARPNTSAEANRLGVDGTVEKFRPRLGGLLSRNPRKISIDPIGRVRPAHD
jgi:CRISPR-associated endonuclease Csn1